MGRSSHGTPGEDGPPLGADVAEENPAVAETDPEEAGAAKIGGRNAEADAAVDSDAGVCTSDANESGGCVADSGEVGASNLNPPPTPAFTEAVGADRLSECLRMSPRISP